MSRLTKRIDENTMCIEVCEKECVEGNTFCPKCKPFGDVMKKLLRYEDLEEQGRLIELPCKVGDELFVHHRTFRGEIVKGVCIGYTWWRTDGFCVMFHSDTTNYGKVDIAFSDFGKTVFLTKEEAEAKLAELKEGAE